MQFVTLVKFRRRPTKEEIRSAPKRAEAVGIKIIADFWCLGQYDEIIIAEAQNQETLLNAFSYMLDFASTETLLITPRDEAIKVSGY